MSDRQILRIGLCGAAAAVITVTGLSPWLLLLLMVLPVRNSRGLAWLVPAAALDAAVWWWLSVLGLKYNPLTISVVLCWGIISEDWLGLGERSQK